MKAQKRARGGAHAAKGQPFWRLFEPEAAKPKVDCQVSALILSEMPAEN